MILGLGFKGGCRFLASRVLEGVRGRNGLPALAVANLMAGNGGGVGENGNGWKLEMYWGPEIDPQNFTSPPSKTDLNLNLNL